MQAIGTGARCVFEHYLDLRWLQKFGDEIWLDRYWGYPNVDRYMAAKKVVEHKRKQPASKIDVTARQRFIDQLDARQEPMAALVSRLWGTTKSIPRWPSHWTGMGTLRDRARKIGPDEEDTYVQIYPVLCALVHPGATPYVGDFEWLEVQIGYGYFYTFWHSWKATEVVIELLGLASQVEQLEPFRYNLAKWMEEAQAVNSAV
jgi:hypothetical protein